MQDIVETKDILEHFSELKDGRRRIPQYPLEEILLVALCGMLSGADDWTTIALWGKSHLDWLKQWRPFENGVASHDTFGRVFSLLDSKCFESCFISWMRWLCPTISPEIAIDGKTLRRSHDRNIGKSAVHLVSAFCHQHGVSLGQIKTNEKSNEITAIPELLKALSVKGAVVTIDAMGNQSKIAKCIIDGGGDYLLAVKNNQPTQYEAIKQFFVDAEVFNYANVSHTSDEQINKDHGRIEMRCCVASEELDWLDKKLKWVGMRSIIMIKATREIRGKTTTENRYYVSSLPANAKHINQNIRNHWGIENRLHWCLDMAFNEDQSRVRNGYSSENLSTLRRIALNLLRKNDAIKVGLKNRRLIAGWDLSYLANLLGFNNI